MTLNRAHRRQVVTPHPTGMLLFLVCGRFYKVFVENAESLG